MKDNEMEKEEKSYFDYMKEIQKEMPNIILPSMGMLDNEKGIEINGMDYIKNSDLKES